MESILEYMIAPEKRLVFERLRGPVSPQDLITLMQQIWSDPSYDRSFNGIVDVRESILDLNPSSLESFAQLILASESASVGRFAIISSKPIETALSFLIAKKLNKGGSISVFSTWDAVVAYLGLPESMLAELEDQQAYDALFG